MANGDDFLKPFHAAAKGELAPFILVVEGSIPDENNRKEGYWASTGTDPGTGQPVATCEWIDRRRRACVGSGGCRDVSHPWRIYVMQD